MGRGPWSKRPIDVLSPMARRFRASRDLAGLTLVEAGERAKMGASTIQQYETGERDPRLTYAARLAEIYGVSLHYLAGIPELQAPIDAAWIAASQPSRENGEQA